MSVNYNVKIGVKDEHTKEKWMRKVYTGRHDTPQNGICKIPHPLGQIRTLASVTLCTFS